VEQGLLSCLEFHGQYIPYDRQLLVSWKREDMVLDSCHSDKRECTRVAVRNVSNACITFKGREAP
jgi:hypothetical protein